MEEAEHDGLTAIVREPYRGSEQPISGSTGHTEVGCHLADLGRDLRRRLSRLLCTELSSNGGSDENACKPDGARTGSFCHERLLAWDCGKIARLGWTRND